MAAGLATAEEAEPWSESARSIPLDGYRWVNDVRWLDESELLVAAGPIGLLRVSLDGAKAEIQPVTDHLSHFAARLGVSGSKAASAEPFHTVVHVDLETSAAETYAPAVQLDFIADVDLLDGRLLLLGASRGSDGSFSPDGAMAWLDRIDRPESLRPVLHSLGPVRHTMGDCGIFDIGVSRFLPDGSFVLLPGVERGLLWFEADGELTAELSADVLGIDTECDLPRETRELYLRSDVMRHTLWLSRRRTVDDMVGMPRGLGVFVRRFEAGFTVWDLLVVRPDGVVDRKASVLRVPSPFAHLRVDWRNGRLAVLVLERGPDEAVSPPYLLIVEVPV